MKTEIKKIQELIRILNRNNIVEFELEEKEFKVRIKTNRGGASGEVVTQVVAPAVQAQPVVAAAPAAEPAKTAAPAADAGGDSDAIKDNQFIFKSPMIGTFYRRPSPDKEPFAKVGDTIKNGDVLCVIEAMKLFNEIEFDQGEGKIVKVLAEDSSPVEYDQPLFLIEKV